MKNKFSTSFHFLNLFIILLFFSCTTTGSLSHSTNKNTDAQTNDSLYTAIHSLGAELTIKNNVPGLAVAVIKNGQIAWVQCIGYADVASKTPVTAQTIFNVGSVSKVVSAWGFMQLTERGAVTLDESVNASLTRWKLPASNFDNSKVTLRRILSHTAGLSVHGYSGFEQGTPLLTLEESLNGKTKRNGERVSVIDEPGTKWDYSGGGYTLAQLLLEEKTKMNFSEYMQKNVFHPLGMTNTSYEWTTEMMAHSATAYDTLGKPIKNRIFTEKAAAGLQTTITDLAHFAELSITKDFQKLHKVLRPETILLMEEPVLPSSTEGESGLGYRFMNYGGFRTIGHTGENIGWTAALFMDLHSKNGIVILCNGSNGDHVWYPVYELWLKTNKK